MKNVKKLFTITGIATIVLFIGFGCTKKQMTQESGPASTPTAPQQQTTSQAPSTQQSTSASQPTGAAPQTSASQTTPGAAGTPSDFNFANAPIYFDYDQHDLKSTAIENLQKKAAWLQKNPKATLLIEGHCDERGTNEYNIALGDRRADTALKYLMSLGIPLHRISTVSFGEERPADAGHDEEAWAQNRRDEFYLKKAQ